VSDQTGNADEKPADKPAGPTFAEVLQFIKDNFVLVSAAALLIGVALATTFLAAYLSEFDWHLLWFVQYADIITFGLLAVGIGSGSVTLLQGFVQAVLAGKTPEQRRSALIILAVLWTIGLALGVWGAVHRGEGYIHIVSGFAVLGSTIALIFVIASYFNAAKPPTATQCVLILLFLVLIAGGLGRWLGQSIDETSGFIQDVSMKDQTFTDVKVVMVMSRHTILLKDGVLFVVPTADITQFKGKGSSLLNVIHPASANIPSKVK
jgi:hypothetical protein